MTSLPAIAPGAENSAPGGAPAPLPVPLGWPAGGSRSAEYEAALAVKFTDAKLYHSPEFQAQLMELAQGKIEAPGFAIVSGIQSELGEVGFEALAATFPVVAVSVVEAELITPLSAGQRAPQSAIEGWQKDPPLNALLSEWGSDGPRLVARVIERIRRIHSRCDAATWNALADWYDALDGDEAVAVTRALAQ